MWFIPSGYFLAIRYRNSTGIRSPPMLLALAHGVCTGRSNENTIITKEGQSDATAAASQTFDYSHYIQPYVNCFTGSRIVTFPLAFYGVA